MKALEILKDYLKKIELYESGYEEHEYEDEDYLKAKVQSKKVYEAIKELEQLENRSCYYCKHWCQEFQSIGICDKGIKEEKQFRESMTYHNFYCNKWENKQ